MIYLSEEKKEFGNRLLNLLYEIFKSRDNAAGKMKVLHSEYDIQLSHSEEGMVDHMCNLSIGIAKENAYKGYNKGYNVGEKHGERIGLVRGAIREKREIALRMLRAQMDISAIAAITRQEESDVRRIAEEEHLPC